MKETMSNLMEEKKYRVACIIAVVAVVLIVILIFAGFSRRNSKNKESGAQNVVAVIGYDEAYEFLCGLRDTSYETQTLAQFDEIITEYFKGKKCTFKDAMNSVLPEIREDDPAYDFITETLKACYNEMDSDCKVPYVSCDATVKYLDFSGTEGVLKLKAKVEYAVSNQDRMTVEERDGEIATYTTKIKQYVNQMLLNNMSESEIKDEVETQMKAWSNSYSDDKIKFRAYIEEIELK
ncbi:MAG: hypothetical protein Q4G58_08470 [bacterium]|nr:hypothetical protein [bacterium]